MEIIERGRDLTVRHTPEEADPVPARPFDRDDAFRGILAVQEGLPVKCRHVSSGKV
jgi:hypothetical protein